MDMARNYRAVWLKLPDIGAVNGFDNDQKQHKQLNR